MDGDRKSGGAGRQHLGHPRIGLDGGDRHPAAGEGERHPAGAGADVDRPAGVPRAGVREDVVDELRRVPGPDPVVLLGRLTETQGPYHLFGHAAQIIDSPRSGPRASLRDVDDTDVDDTDSAHKDLVRRGYDALSYHYRAEDDDPGERGEWIERLIARVPAGVSFPGQSFDAVVSLYMFIHLPMAEQAPLIGRIAGWLRVLSQDFVPEGSGGHALFWCQRAA